MAQACSPKTGRLERCLQVCGLVLLNIFEIVGMKELTYFHDCLAEGAVGGTAQSIGGPLDQQGMVGKHFGADGSIGGTAQKLAEKNESH